VDANIVIVFILVVNRAYS